jgi:hypothetical protein
LIRLSIAVTEPANSRASKAALRAVTASPAVTRVKNISGVWN